MALSLDTFLQELQSEASLESQGQFTLDMQHARDKLAAYSLEKTDHLLLKLVQCGVAGGATRLDLETTNRHIRFVMHGLVFGQRELGQILNYLLQSDVEQRALRHLATAVNTAVATRPSAIALASWNGQRGQLVRWSSEGKQVEQWEPPASEGAFSVFSLVRTRAEWRKTLGHLFNQRDFLGMLFGWRTGWSTDQELLADRAGWCPIPIYVNGKLLPELPLVMSRDRASQREQVFKHSQEARLPCLRGDCRGVRVTGRAVKAWPGLPFADGAVTALMTAGMERKGMHTPSYLEFTSDGVIVKRNMIMGLPAATFVRVVASADGYQTDLNGLALTSSTPEYQELSDQLLGEAARLFMSLELGPLPQLSFAGR